MSTFIYLFILQRIWECQNIFKNATTTISEKKNREQSSVVRIGKKKAIIETQIHLLRDGLCSYSNSKWIHSV